MCESKLKLTKAITLVSPLIIILKNGFQQNMHKVAKIGFITESWLRFVIETSSRNAKVIVYTLSFENASKSRFCDSTHQIIHLQASWLQSVFQNIIAILAFVTLLLYGRWFLFLTVYISPTIYATLIFVPLLFWHNYLGWRWRKTIHAIFSFRTNSPCHTK